MLKLTPKIAAYCLSEEGIVLEAYKDSEGIWTWAGGVTNASGHIVFPRYKDSPQSLERCLEVTVWLMGQKYLPAVDRAFAGYALTEAQIAAALSFHWNTGAILRSSWVQMVKDGNLGAAEDFLETHYTNGGDLAPRRLREAHLFFDNIWPDDLSCPAYPVAKPSYTPAFRRAKRIETLPILEGMPL